MKRAHLVGNRGCLGTYIEKTLTPLIPVVPYNTETFDITDKSKNELIDVQPGDIVIWNAAYTNVSDNDIGKHFAVNVEPLKRLIKDMPPVHFIYISSLYCQEDISHLSAYSQTKSIAETIVKSHFDIWNIIRFSGLIGYDPGRKNMLYQFIDKEEINLNGYLSTSIVYAGNIATWILRTIIQQQPELIEIGSVTTFTKHAVLFEAEKQTDHNITCGVTSEDNEPDPLRPEQAYPKEGTTYLYDGEKEIQAAVADILAQEEDSE